MGELLALLTALIWAAAVILLKRSGESVPPFALNLFRVTVSSVLLLPTAFLAGQASVTSASLSDILLLVASGAIGVAISDTLFHASLNRIGAGISAIIDCLYSPLTVLLAFLALNERLSTLQLVGLALVLGGVFAAARHEPPYGVAPRQVAVGVVWGVLAMVALAVGIVIAKPVLDRSTLLWAATVRQVGCLAVMLPVALLSRRRAQILGALRPSSVWLHSLPGAVLGSYLGLMCWIGGLKYTKVGVAAILNQSSTIYILILAAIFLKEPLTRRKLLASLVALAGIILVTI
ncbi:MAG: DMT family transporter [Thermoanaerobaculaceae bacterium]|nr:DMT family transporter [Thermoanaerobaculaceae bacterium]